MFDLPFEDPEDEDGGLADTFHGLQPQLLDETLSLPQYPEDRTYRAFDLNIYYDPEHTGWNKRPDWFLVVGAHRLYQGLVPRWSYVMWEEKIAPTIVIEFLSRGTEGEDLGRFYDKTRPIRKKGKPPEKFVVYEEILKIPHYIVYDWRTTKLRYFRLLNGRYEEQQISPDNPKVWIPELNLGMGLRTESFRGIVQPWLRWCDESGIFFPTPTETANAIAELAQAQAADAQAQLEVLQQQQTQSVLKLVQLGLEVQQIAEIVGVTIAQVTAIQATL